MSSNETLKELPQKPGVYLMLDSLGNVIYVGKAKNLKNRVSQYFHNHKNRDPKVADMIAHIHTFKYQETDTELDALLEECRLIKEIRPKYNRQLKNSKKYMYLKIADEQFPKLSIVNDKIEDGAQYFGPFTSPHRVETAVQYLNELYPIRKCTSPRIVQRSNGCLFLQLGKCLGVCTGRVSRGDYWVHIRKIKQLISGQDLTDVDELSNMLQAAIEDLKFEKATQYREYYLALQHVVGKQSLIQSSRKNKTILAFEFMDSEFIKLFLIQGNRLLYGNVFNRLTTNCKELAEHLIQVIVEKCGTENSEPVRLTQLDIDEAQIINSYLKNNREKITSIRIPMTRLKGKALPDTTLIKVLNLFYYQKV